MIDYRFCNNIHNRCLIIKTTLFPLKLLYVNAIDFLSNELTEKVYGAQTSAGIAKTTFECFPTNIIPECVIIAGGGSHEN